MAVVRMADDGISFDGDTLSRGPLGGAETAFVSLAEALAARGHDVIIHNRCGAAMTRNGVAWQPLEEGLPDSADLYIANRGDRLIPLVRDARARIFWIHNPAQFLNKWRYWWKLARWRPTVVFSSGFHAASISSWMPTGGKVTIPYGISADFLNADPPRDPPPPHVAFTSSPLRSLDWLLDLWEAQIRPQVPTAELHIFSSPITYGSHGDARADAMNAVLDRAGSMAAQGVRLREPLPKAGLADALTGFRAILYRGDPGETYCLAIGEAQAVGIPAVVQDIGCVAERVIDGQTGFVARDDSDFARRGRDILTDDELWRRLQGNALDRQRRWSWDDAAAAFEEMLPA
ncbi:MAG: glycosyltransferase family 4 protein [Alphaproteobacteria bacterium]